METPLILLGLILATNGFYIGLCLIDEKVKSKLVAKRDENMRETKAE